MKLFILKSLFLIAPLLISLPALAQKTEKAKDELYYSAPKSGILNKPIPGLSTDTDKVQYYLGRYHKERQVGFTFVLIGALTGGASALLANNKPKDAKTALIISGVSSLTAVVIFLDAEKWLKKASISISPTSLVINF
jgi:hypothetical protein